MSPNVLWWRFHYDFAAGCRTVHERSTGCWKLNSSERPRNPEMWNDKHTDTWVGVPAIATSRRRGTPRALQSASSHCQSNEHCEVASGGEISALSAATRNAHTAQSQASRHHSRTARIISKGNSVRGRSPALLPIRLVELNLTHSNAKTLHDSTSIEGLSGLSKPIDASQRPSTSKRRLRCQCMQQAISSPLRDGRCL